MDSRLQRKTVFNDKRSTVKTESTTHWACDHWGYVRCGVTPGRCELTEDLVDGGVGGQGAVEDAELPLEPLGDVVATPARVTHGGQELDVHDVGELPGLLQVVEARLLHQLTHNLVGDLRKKEKEGVTARLKTQRI